MSNKVKTNEFFTTETIRKNSSMQKLNSSYSGASSHRGSSVQPTTRTGAVGTISPVKITTAISNNNLYLTNNESASLDTAITATAYIKTPVIGCKDLANSKQKFASINSLPLDYTSKQSTENTKASSGSGSSVTRQQLVLENSLSTNNLNIPVNFSKLNSLSRVVGARGKIVIPTSHSNKNIPNSDSNFIKLKT